MNKGDKKSWRQDLSRFFFVNEPNCSAPKKLKTFLLSFNLFHLYKYIKVKRRKIMKSKFELRFQGLWKPEDHYSKSFIAMLHMTGNRDGSNKWEKDPLSILRSTLQEWGLPENVWSNNKLVVEIRCESKVLWRKSFNEKLPGWYDIFAPHPIGWERISGRPMSWPYWELSWKAYAFLGKDWEIWVNGCKTNAVVTNPFATKGYVMMYADESSNYWSDAKPSKPGKKSIKAVLDISNPNDVDVVPEEYVGYNNPDLPPKMFIK